MTHRSSSLYTSSTSLKLIASAWASSHSATSAEARDEPSSTLTAAVVPFAADITTSPSAPDFAKTPSREIAMVSGWPGPATAHEFSLTASVRAAASREIANGLEASGQATQCDCVHRCPTPVNPGAIRPLTGEPGDHIEDALLYRMLRLEVSRQRPVISNTREQHRGVFAGATHVQPAGGGSSRPDERLPSRGITRFISRAAERILGDVFAREEFADQLYMGDSAGVTRGSNRRVNPAEHNPAGHHRECLEWFQAAACKHGRCGFSELPNDIALGGEHNGGSGVAGLNESAALDRAKFYRAGQRERAVAPLLRELRIHHEEPPSRHPRVHCSSPTSAAILKTFPHS